MTRRGWMLTGGVLGGLFLWVRGQFARIGRDMPREAGIGTEEFRRRTPQPLPAVYADWDIDPATRIITHEPTGLSFAVYRKPEKSGYGDYVVRHVGGTPRTDDELAAVADMGLCWYVVFGSQMQRPRGQ